jgi:hypothetical protein
VREIRHSLLTMLFLIASAAAAAALVTWSAVLYARGRQLTQRGDCASIQPLLRRSGLQSR